MGPIYKMGTPPYIRLIYRPYIGQVHPSRIFEKLKKWALFNYEIYVFFQSRVGLISDIRPGPYMRGNTVCLPYVFFS